MLIILIRKEFFMIWLKEFCTQKVLDFISMAWGDLANLKLFWEFIFKRSHAVMFAFIRVVSA